MEEGEDGAEQPRGPTSLPLQARAPFSPEAQEQSFKGECSATRWKEGRLREEVEEVENSREFSQGCGGGEGNGESRQIKE